MRTTLRFAGRKLALIVRGKTSHTHNPGVLAQHADCILPDGAPVGYFGTDEAASGGGYGSGSWNRSGLNMEGVVADYAWFDRHRPYYVDASMARTYKLKSTVLTVDVTAEQATLFTNYWNKLKLDPGTFHILGLNCSTRASGAFVSAGVVARGIPGLDTPDHLYRQILAASKSATYHSGYLGFAKSGSGFSVVIES